MTMINIPRLDQVVLGWLVDNQGDPKGAIKLVFGVIDEQLTLTLERLSKAGLVDVTGDYIQPTERGEQLAKSSSGKLGFVQVEV